MAKLVFHYLPICNEWINVPNTIEEKILKKVLNILPNIKTTRKQLPKTFKMLPLWRNFVKSGRVIAAPNIKSLTLSLSKRSIAT